jgi:hypothetical protein
MLSKKFASKEFSFIGNKLQQIARLLIDNKEDYRIEAAFIIGCLHTICHDHSKQFLKEHEQDNPNVDP